jgi:hypothetical protein
MLGGYKFGYDPTFSYKHLLLTRLRRSKREGKAPYDAPLRMRSVMPEGATTRKGLILRSILDLGRVPLSFLLRDPRSKASGSPHRLHNVTE